MSANKKPWPADLVERRPVSELIPSARNARTHSDEQVGQIAASIEQWGWTVPVLIDERGEIIAGHGRVMAAHRLGIADVPCMVAAGWSDEQKRAYLIADNKLTLNGGWDDDILSDELRELGEAGFDLGLTGFGDDELASLVIDKSVGLTDPDDVPDAPTNPVTRRGDIWICGNHRLLCGDSTVEADVAAVLNGVKPHLMVTDPPYGVEYDPGWRNQAGAAKTKRTGKVLNDDRADWSEAYKLFPGEVAYVWHPAAGGLGLVFGETLQSCGFEIRMVIIWAKNRFPIGRGHYHVQHEPCYYAVRSRSGATAHWQGSRKEATLWHISGKDQDEKTVHGTQKPVECMRRPIVNNSSPGQAVYEPFCGSGTTMIAAEMEGRHAYCIELSEAYCDVIVKRWQEFAGLAAVLESDGRSFDEIAAVRAQEAA